MRRVNGLALCLGLLFASFNSASAQSFVNWESPHVHPLDMTPDASLLLAVSTADNRLLAFTLTSGTPVLSGAAQVGLDPVSVRARSNAEAWVVNHISDSISIVNLVTGHVRATLSTDDEPCDVVFAGSPKRAFVTCSQANTVLVFNPLNLDAAPTRISIRGEDPRALAVSPTGDKVYAAIFESGNQTTLLAGGTKNLNILPYPPLVVGDPIGPYAGQNPPPNSGSSFDPPINPTLPTPPAVGLIVRRDLAGRWMDDNQADWTALVSGPEAAHSGRPVGWTLLDHDVAIIDTSTLAEALRVSVELPHGLATVPVSALALWCILLGTIVPFSLSIAALKHLPATTVGIVATIEPVVAAVVAWVWLGEALVAVQIAGGVVVLVGIVLAETSR